MPAKKKKQSKNWDQPGLRTPKNTFVQRNKLLVVVIVFILGGAIGVALQRYSAASTSQICWKAGMSNDNPEQACKTIQNNPPLVCEANKPVKLDVYMLFDRTGSMDGQFALGTHQPSGENIKTVKHFAEAFIKASEGSGTRFAVGYLDNGEDGRNAIAFTADTNRAIDWVRKYEVRPYWEGTAGYSPPDEWPPGSVYPESAPYTVYQYNLVDLYALLKKDQRPDVQNLFIFLTDNDGVNGEMRGQAMLDDIRKRGNRTLLFLPASAGGYSMQEKAVIRHHVLGGGTRVDTGNIWTSDIITGLVGRYRESVLYDYKQFIQNLPAQLKTCPPNSGNNGGGNGNGNGNGGNGNGTGNNGTGQGNTGSGSGQRGSGSGGGGTSATRQGNSPSPLPTPSPQGTKKQDPPKQEPSPFFDGKLYGIGSDPDAQSPVDLVKNPSKILKNIWFYVIVGSLVLGGGVGAGYFFWWRRRKS